MAEAINNMLLQNVAWLCSATTSFYIVYITVIEESVFWSVADREPSAGPGVFSGLNYRVWVSVKLASVVSRCVRCEEGGCLCRRRGNKAHNRCWWEVGCFEEAYWETASLDICNMKRELSEPLQWKLKIRIDSPITEATLDMELNGPAFSLLWWAPGLTQLQKLTTNDTGDNKAFGTQQEIHKTLSTQTRLFVCFSFTQ